MNLFCENILLSTSSLKIVLEENLIYSIIGDGLKENVSSSTGDTKANKVNITFFQNDYNQEISSLQPFTEMDFRNLSSISGVEKVEKQEGFDLSSILGENLVGDGKYLDKSTNIYASAYENVDSQPILSDGRYFEENDVNNDLIILKHETAKKFFENPKDAIGKSLNINSTMFEIIGVIEKSEDIFSSGEDLVQKSSIDRITNSRVEQSDESISGIDVYILPGYDYNNISNNFNILTSWRNRSYEHNVCICY